MNHGAASRRLPSRFAKALAGLGLATPLIVATWAPASATAAARTGRRPLPAPGRLVEIGSAPVAPRGARLMGSEPADAVVSAGAFLAPRDPSALAAAAAAVSSPRSPSYGRFLSRGAFAGVFGPSAATVGLVESQLRADGLSVTEVSSDNLFIRFTGTAARVERAFHTGISRWRLADGEVGTQTTTAPSLPAGIAGSVTAIIGLDDLVRPHSTLERHGRGQRIPRRHRIVAGRAAAPAAGAPAACPAAVTDAQQLNGVTDSQLAASYGADGLYGAGDLGAGQTVAIYELEPFAMSDIAAFDKCYFGVSHTGQVSVVPVEGGQPGGPGSGEALLDIEDVSAMAPAAHIVVYEAPLTTSGTLDDYVAIVDQDLAHEVSTSWGLCESGAQIGDPGLQQAENELFQQATVQGQSVFGPAGDDGSDDCSTGTTPVSPLLSVDDPASQPFVVGVGGTTIYSTPPSAPPGEAVWNDGPSGGGTGGGISDSWPMPAWQRYSGVPGVLNSYSTTSGDAYEACRTPVAAGGAGFGPSTLCRQVPDVTALADEGTGITVYAAEYGGWTTFGGTSSSTPLWAAMIADVNASQECSATPGTPHDLGFVSPALYEVASNPVAGAEAFNDITSGNNDTLGAADGAFPATPGYDMASGLGSPRLTDPATGATGLASLLCGTATAPRPTVSTLSPQYGTTAGGTRVTIGGSGFEKGGKDEVKAVMFGPLAGSGLQVTSPTRLAVTAPPAYAPPTGGLPAVLGQGVHVAVLSTVGAVNAPSAADVYRYVAFQGGSQAPTVSYVGPSGGPDRGGTEVTILGSGFALGGTPVVEFGGLPSPAVKVLDDHTLVARTPARTAWSRCARFDARAPICQVEVTVGLGLHTSAVTPILPALEGSASFNPQGVIVPAPGTETVSAPTEFDYAPVPTVTSVTPSPGSEQGGQIAVHGTGFNLLTFQWENYGPPAIASSQDNQIAAITPTEIDISVPSSAKSTEGRNLPGGLSIQTLGGLSNTVAYRLAGVPKLTALSSHVGLTSGGQPLTITGAGLTDANQVLFVSRYQPALNPPATQDVIDHVSDTEIEIAAPSDFPLPTDVVVCSVSGCSKAQPAVDLFTYAYPGRAVVSTSAPSTGPVAGGTLVEITGSDLSAASGVWFGSVESSDFYNPPGEFPGGENNVVYAYAPPGAAGKVPITVQTLGGTAGGWPPSAHSPGAVFTYS